jgi:8-oxo-dGTP pyrophosphatase MutT (NUDIX family)
VSAALEDLNRTQRYPPEDPKGPAHQAGLSEVTLENFAVEVPVGWEPRLDREDTEYKWVPLDEAPSLFHWDNTRVAFQILRDRLARRSR